MLRDRGLAVLNRYNILTLAGGEGGRLCQPRAAMSCPRSASAIRPAPVRPGASRLHAEGRLAVNSEITAHHSGIAPDDPRLEPCFALAEELDIPVGIHLGPGPTNTAYFATPGYRVAARDPLRLEPVLIRHPRLGLHAMHAGWPFADGEVSSYGKTIDPVAGCE